MRVTAFASPCTMDSWRGPPAQETSVESSTPLPDSSAKAVHPPLPRLSSAARVSGMFDRLSTRLAVGGSLSPIYLSPISRETTLANMSTSMRQQLKLARDSASARRSSTRTSASRMDEASTACACTAHTTLQRTCMHCTHYTRTCMHCTICTTHALQASAASKCAREEVASGLER